MTRKENFQNCSFFHLQPKQFNIFIFLSFIIVKIRFFCLIIGYRCKKTEFLPKYVVSMDEFDMSRNGIRHINLRDFLLAEEWK